MSDVDMGSRCSYSRYWWRHQWPCCILWRHFKTYSRYSFGGENITNDIRMGLCVLNQAGGNEGAVWKRPVKRSQSECFYHYPGLKGKCRQKEISVKNLANIIQVRMAEILDFVTYHLKQVGMDNRALNGGVILTGGGLAVNASYSTDWIHHRVKCKNRLPDWTPCAQSYWRVKAKCIQPASG